MKRPSALLALALAMGACGQPQQEEAEIDRNDAPARVGEAIEQGADRFRDGAREALNELGAAFDDLQESSANLQGESASAWAETREEIAEARVEIETDLERLQTAAAEDVDQIEARIASNIETMTHRVERAKLLATDSNEEFVAEARERLQEADQGIQSLGTEAAALPLEAREGAAEDVETLRQEANEVRETLTSIATEAPQQIAEKRDAVADDVAALKAAVRRESFEIRSALND
jgi:hypothetical protein